MIIKDFRDGVRLECFMSDAALYELLAEEAIELGAAALKMARILRCENPTPVTTKQAYAHLAEEVADTNNALTLLRIMPDTDICVEKLNRMIDRLSAENDLTFGETSELKEDIFSRCRREDADE